MPNLALRRALAMLLLLGFSGCLGLGDDREREGFRGSLALPYQCIMDPSWDPCRNSTPAETVVEGLLLTPTGVDSGAGVSVVSGDRNVTLRDVTIQGFATGIFVASTDCSWCTVRLENVTLIGTSAAPWHERVALRAYSPVPPYTLPHLWIDGLSIEGFVLGVDWVINEDHNSASVHVQNASVACLRQGLRIAVQVLRVENVTVDGCRGIGLHAKGFDEAAVRRATLTKNWQGMVAAAGDFDAPHMRVETSLFDGNEVGGFMNMNGPATLTGNAFRDNGGAPNKHAYSNASTTNVVYAVFAGAAALTLRANCIQGNPGWGAARTLLAPVDFDGNWWGSNLGPRPGRAVGGDYTPPQPVVPVGDGDLVPYDIVVADFLTQPPASCGLLT